MELKRDAKLVRIFIGDSGCGGLITIEKAEVIVYKVNYR